MNKKAANIMLTTIVKILLLVACLGFLMIAGCKLYASLTYSPQEDMMKDQLDIFASQINALTYSDQEYTAMPVFLGLMNSYGLVAFDRETNLVEIRDLNDASKPSSCRDGSCICIYPLHEFGKNPLYCSNLDVDYIFAGSSYKDLVKNIGDLPEGGVNIFFRGKERDSNAEDYTESIRSDDSYLFTSHLGFNYASSFFDIALYTYSNVGVNYLSIYAEIISVNDYKILIFHPYSNSLNNRKYYLIKSEGISGCNGEYLHSVIKKDSVDYTYCKMSSQGLVESGEKIQKCEPNKIINTTCVCGNRAVSSGFCVKDSKNILVDDNPRFCTRFRKVEDPSCPNYESKYYCIYDICNLNLNCKWDGSQCNDN